MEKIMSLKAQYKLKDQILLKRLNKVLPDIMAERDIDMWILIGDEYNEGPCIKTFLPSSFYHARRKTILIFSLVNGQLKRYIVSKPDFTIGQFYEPVLLKPPHFDFEMFYRTFATDYDIEMIRKHPVEDLYTCINRIIEEDSPNKIALNFSSLNAFSDGLSHQNYTNLLTHLNPKHHVKIVSAEYLATRWLESRIPEELELMKKITLKTREIIQYAYSRKVITPGETTIGDLRFYLMESAIHLGMTPWFDATLWIRRKDCAHLEDDDVIILEQDLLHCDFGVTYAGYCSDVQEMAYVKGENDDCLLSEYQSIHQQCMKLQDLVVASFRLGLTGNEILRNALASAEQHHISGARIYTHPIGYHGHGAGPIIGQFSNQKYVSGMGDYPLHNHTCYALELCIQTQVTALDNLKIMYGQEIDILFKDDQVHFYAGRQEELHII